MLYQELTPDQHAAYLRALHSSHTIRSVFFIHDPNEARIASLTAPANSVITGAIQYDATATISRSLTATLLDPKFKLHFDRFSPSASSVFVDRFVSVHYGVFVEEIAKWVDVPVFWGPLSRFERDGPEVQIEVLGKEALMLDPQFAFKGYTIPAGTRIDDAIRMVAKRHGETRFDIPDLPQTLNRPQVVSAQTEPWLALTSRASVKGFTQIPEYHGLWPMPDQAKPSPGLIERLPEDYGLYYNGQGQLVARRKTTQPSFHFQHDKHLLSAPQVAFDISKFVNVVAVMGAGSAHAEVPLPAENPLSPQSLARNGVPRWMAAFISAPELASNTACYNRAVQELNRRADEGVDVSFDCLPIPHLEENERVVVSTDKYQVGFNLRSFTIPLTADEPMSIGVHRRNRLGHRKRRHPHWGPHGGAGGSRGGSGGHGGRRRRGVGWETVPGSWFR